MFPSSQRIHVKDTESNGPEGSIDIPPSKRNMSLVGYIVNMIHCVIGAGILGLPYSFKKLGYGSGIILLLLGVTTSCLGIFLLNKTADRLGRGGELDNLTFGSVSKTIHPFIVPLVSSLLNFINCVVMCIAYLNQLAVFMVSSVQFFVGSGFDETAWYANRNTYIFIAFAIVTPLCFPRKVTVLQYTSAIGEFFILYLAVLVTVYALKPADSLCASFLEANGIIECTGPKCCNENQTICCIGEIDSFTGTFTDYAGTFPAMITAFCCASQAFTLFNSLKNPTVKRLTIGTITSETVCFFLYVWIALAGYATYGSKTSQDLLSSYPLATDVTVARLGFAIILLTSFPLFAHVARDSLVDIVYLVGANCMEVNEKVSKIVYITSVCTVLITSLLVSLLNIGLFVLFQFVGSICVANIAFTLPGVFYLFTYPERSSFSTRILAICLAIFGSFVCITNIVLWALGYSL